MPRRNDQAVGIIVAIVGASFSVTVWLTVPEAAYGVGPRAFPFWLGIALTALSLMLLLPGTASDDEIDDAEWELDEDKAVAPFWLQVGTLLAVCLTIAAYGWLMQTVGFIWATLVVVAFTLIVTLGERRPFLIVGMTVGISVGAWLVFGQLLGAYMPPGSWRF